MLRRGLSILFGVLLAWLMLEILLRLTFPILPLNLQMQLRDLRRTPFAEARLVAPPIWHTDGYYLTVTQPGVEDETQYGSPTVSFQVSTQPLFDENSHLGFRVPHTGWTPRWPVDGVVIGDSFTFCFTEYEDCWVTRLGEAANLSLINLGIPVTGTLSHARVLERFGMPAQPRFVIWQWFGNDANDDYGLARLNDEIPDMDEDAPPPPAASAPAPMERWLLENSALYVLLHNLRRDEAEMAGLNQFVDPYYVQEDGVRLAFGQPYILGAFDMTQPRNQAGWGITQTTLLETQAALGDVPLVIVLIPTKEEVYAHLTHADLGEGRLVMLSEGRRLMLDFCATHNLRCLDTTPALTAAAQDGQQVYFVADLHLNARGNQIVALAVADYLREQGLVAGE